MLFVLQKKGEKKFFVVAKKKKKKKEGYGQHMRRKVKFLGELWVGAFGQTFLMLEALTGNCVAAFCNHF